MLFIDELSDITKLISKSVGNNARNKEEDVRAVRDGLEDMGFFSEEEKERDYKGNSLGIITRGLDAKIKDFQSQNDLKVDGFLNPGGETEKTLLAKREEKRMEKSGQKKPYAFDPLLSITGRPENIKADKTIYGNVTVNTKNVANALEKVLLARAGQNETPQPTRKPELEGEFKELKSHPVEDKTMGEMERLDDEISLPTRKPEAIFPTRRGDKLLNFIGKLESSDNYNIIAGGQEKALTQMSIKEVRQLQKKLQRQGAHSTAVGRYQIIDDKMDDLIRWMDIDENSIFNEKLQDQMGRELLRRRGFEKFKAGEMKTADFIKKLSQEWAAIPADESNESYYKGVGNNKALVDFKTVKDLLEKN